MNLNYLKIGSVWLFKAAILISLSLAVILLASPRSAKAATVTGDLITSGGVPALKIGDDTIAVFTGTDVANQFWGQVGAQVKVDCDLRNSTLFSLKSVTTVANGEKVWQDNGAVLGDQSGQGGGLIVKQMDKVQGSLLIRHTQPAVDVTPVLIYGAYSEVTLMGLGTSLREELLKLASGYGGNIIAEGELDGLAMWVDNLWVNGIQRKQLGFVQ